MQQPQLQPGNRPAISIWFFVSLFFIFLFWKQCGTIEDQRGYKALSIAKDDSLHTYKNREGLNIAERKLLSGTISQLKELHLSDSSKLAKLINKNTLSATVLNTTTSASITSATVIEYKTDTLVKCDTSCYPVYNTDYYTRWEHMQVLAGKDSVRVNYQVYNEFEIVQENRKEGPWYHRSTIPYIMVKNNNPRTATTALNSFAITTPKPKRGRWLIIGLAAGFIGGTYLVK